MSQYITTEGYQRLQQEHDFLWRQKRPEVTRQVSEAAALGDRSENAEYIYGKKQLREIDRRLRFLRKKLEELTVVAQTPANQDKVYFAAWVELENLATSQPLTVRIVGADEFDHLPTYISVHSPMAKALLGKDVDDIVIVHTPAGKVKYSILDIRYES